MNNSNRSQLYEEEFKFIFEKKGSGVRRATVIAAFIEGQVFYLANNFLKSKDIIYKPAPSQEYSQSINILKTNGKISKDEIEEIKKFRKQRNKSIHGIFKGMTRNEWERQNKIVVEIGRPIVKKLDKKLFIQN